MGRTSDARTRILKSASDLMHDKGYSAVGIAEVCKGAGVQKGSFYHFFRSKQALALAVLDAYWKHGVPVFEALENPDVPPLERLKAFFGAQRASHEACRAECGAVRGCLIGNLSLELSTQDSDVRDALQAILRRQIDALEVLVRDIQAAHDSCGRSPRTVARDVLAYIEGQTLLAKAENDPSGMKDAHDGVLCLLGLPARGLSVSA